MNFIIRLITEINEAIGVLIGKLNLIYTIKEDKVNKKDDLTSNSGVHYPNVPAVKTGINNAITTANNYTNVHVEEELKKYIPKTEKGSNNGVAELDATGKIPASQLPSYVDDVIDIIDFVTENPSSGMVAGNKYYNTVSGKIYEAVSPTGGFEVTPESDKIYVKLYDSTIWRWSGTTMAQVNTSLALGETSTTAYRGDRGKIAYDHSVNMGDATTLVPDWSAQLEGQVNF